MSNKNYDEFGYSIEIKNLVIYGYHGMHEEEKILGQKFLISLKVLLLDSVLIKNDDINSTVSYSDLCRFIERVFSNRKFSLLETCCDFLGKSVMNEYLSIKKLHVKIKKPCAPIKNSFEYVSVSRIFCRHKVFVGIGSNLGNRKENIENAIKMLNNEFTKVKQSSKLYETAPFGYINQDKFLNAALELETLYTPYELLDWIFKIETTLKRERRIKWGPRTIDIDILFYDNLLINSNDLTIPHPLIKDRLFVLEPLCEICPNFLHPVFKKSIISMFNELNS